MSTALGGPLCAGLADALRSPGTATAGIVGHARVGEIHAAWTGRTVFAADEGGARRVLASGVRFIGIGSPAWAPDGARVAFSWFRCAAKTDDVYTIRPDGSGVRPQDVV